MSNYATFFEDSMYVPNDGDGAYSSSDDADDDEAVRNSSHDGMP